MSPPELNGSDSGVYRPSKTMLVAWALGECGGDQEFVDKLDVAVYGFRAYPDYFGFQKYPEYPDVDSVRVQLTDLVKTKHSRPFGLDEDAPLARQRRDGPITEWRLTENGIRWWKTNRDRLRLWVERNARSEFRTAKSSSGRVRTESDHKARLVERIRETSGFQLWARSPSAGRREVGLQSFFSSFGIGPRTGVPEYRDARDRVMEAAAGDSEVLGFLRYLDSQFGEDYKRILSGQVEI